jgi:acyl-CoA synthetase (AMP-forming)/AMP-acid ligase II
VTTLWLTAGLFHQLVEDNLPGLAGVRQLLAGGDVLAPGHVRRVVEELPGTRLINGYGPTENTTFTCCHPVAAVPESSVPLGRPIANTRVYVLDRHLAPVAAGVAGELCAGGDGLARGYLDRPEWTAERFVPNPFGEPGERLYRTGDLARFRSDGRIEFLGRIDTQVKIRGFRIEPEEIETELARHPGVREAAVVARPGREGRRLIAYVVPASGWEGGSLREGLRTHLRQRLPEPMIPSVFLEMPYLPFNANGKLDRKALPEPEPANDQDEYVAPRTPVEELIAGIWAEVLGLERVGVCSDFFALGGHSLLATRVVTRVRQVLGVDLGVRELFEARTVEGMTLAVAMDLLARADTEAAVQAFAAAGAAG